MNTRSRLKRLAIMASSNAWSWMDRQQEQCGGINTGRRDRPRAWKLGRSSLALLCALVALPASGSPLTLYGFGARSVGLAGAEVADADDASATFYNPALLTRPTRVTFGFGLQYVRPELKIRERNLHFGEANAPVYPDDFAQWSFGVIFPLGGKVKNRVSLGIGITMPQGYIVRIQTVDAASPNFYLYQSSAQKMALVPAIAVRVTDWLSLGVGLQVLARFGGDTQVAVDLFTRKVNQRQMEIALRTREALVAGFSVGPLHGVRVGGVFRQEIGLDYVVPANLVLEELGTLDLRLSGTAVWSPNTFGVGMSYELPGKKARVSFDLSYGMWSRAPSPEVTVLVNTGGAVLEGLGLASTLDLCSDKILKAADGEIACLPHDPGFVDNLSPKFGFELELTKALTLRLGYAFRPTPVPNQVGRSNYLDASTHTLGAGLGVTFKDPLEIFAQPVSVDFGGQAMLLARRAVDKGSDGVVEYDFGGSLIEFAVSVRYQF